MSLLFVVDLETTSLEPHAGGVWDLAVVAVRDGRVVDGFETLVWPGRECLQRRHLEVIQQVSGVLPGAALLMLVDQAVPGIPVAREALLRWMCAQAGALWQPSPEQRQDPERERVPLRMTSYNRPFDSAWLEALPWSLTYFVRALALAELEWAPCVMEAARREMGLERWPKLGLACAHFGIGQGGAHRALADARAAAELAIRLGIA